MSHLGVSFYVIAIFILGVSDKGGNKVCVNTTLYRVCVFDSLPLSFTNFVII